MNRIGDFMGLICFLWLHFVSLMELAKYDFDMHFSVQSCETRKSRLALDVLEILFYRFFRTSQFNILLI